MLQAALFRSHGAALLGHSQARAGSQPEGQAWGCVSARACRSAVPGLGITHMDLASFSAVLLSLGPGHTPG